MLEKIDTLLFKSLDYPEILKGSWMNFTFFKDHRDLDGICSIYFNNDYPSGSVFLSDYILNDYPDIYATWGKPDEENNIFANRMLVSEHLRGSGLGKASLLYGATCLKVIFNKNLKHKYGSKAGNRLYTSVFNIDEVEDTPIEGSLNLNDDFFIQPAYPYVFFGKRVI